MAACHSLAPITTIDWIYIIISSNCFLLASGNGATVLGNQVFNAICCRIYILCFSRTCLCHLRVQLVDYCRFEGVLFVTLALKQFLLVNISYLDVLDV